MRRCITRCGSPAFPSLDRCLACEIDELARRVRKPKRQRRRYHVSVKAEVYARLEEEARRRGQSVRSLMSEVLDV